MRILDRRRLVMLDFLINVVMDRMAILPACLGLGVGVTIPVKPLLINPALGSPTVAELRVTEALIHLSSALSEAALCSIQRSLLSALHRWPLVFDSQHSASTTGMRA